MLSSLFYQPKLTLELFCTFHRCYSSYWEFQSTSLKRDKYFPSTCAIDSTLTDKDYLSLVVIFIHLDTMKQGSWAGATALCIEVEWHWTIAVSAWCSVHQPPKYLLALKLLCIPLGCIYKVYNTSMTKPIVGSLTIYIVQMVCLANVMIGID